MAVHYFKKDLNYIGFGGLGKQVRDVLHIEDLSNLLEIQLNNLQKYSGKIYNVGGGIQNSLSLQETTILCKEITGNSINIDKELNDRPVDFKYYISDCSKIQAESNWVPQKTKYNVMEDIMQWMCDYENDVRSIFN